MCQIEVPEGDYHEIQIGFDGTATTLTPTLTSVILVFDNTMEESKF